MAHDDDYESVLLIIRECFVYNLPPRTRSAGFRAADWKVDEPLWEGRLRVLASSTHCTIRLEDSKTGELFAECHYDKQGVAVEPVLDSSRYFVIKVQNQDQHAFIGLGFQDRSEAFDFNVVLQDYRKQGQADEQLTKEVDTKPKVDYSLKEGQTISINLGGSFV
ncbi:adaptin ear-binding coat-associated protein 1 NECAP-1 [Dimargaris cristalligena]|uniref:Adaptin ear-binding coat-associated protein 1 NECAP-1 n=1 Tax=Dimargaris cristalligena TaxID=215637 RepID=A0A4P9ZZC2_9FUNG|nr:adaptin ear-binding coat-associated protein 1 NECAP-1 [Dimargaris cristalligena]|eukprot:RKP39073.1 adaptin ear-binding coat-associated protein 1 NECAP-1 [Dimargaris cristalligena]